MHRLSLFLSYAAMMCLAIGVSLVPVFLTALGIEFGGMQGLTNEQLGRIGGVTFVGVVLGVALAGPAADRLGPRPFVLGGNFLIALGLLMLGTARHYTTVLPAVFVMGFGTGVLDMVLSPIVCALCPDRRTSAMNWLHAFYCIGAVTTVLLATLALHAGFTWRSITLGFSPAPLIIGAFFLGLKIPALVQDGQSRTRLRQLVRMPAFLLSLTAIFLAGATELGMAQWLPAYVESTLGYSQWTGGMALLAFSIAMAVGRIAGGTIAHRFTAFQTMTFCCGVLVALYLLACYAPWNALALTACVAIGLTVSGLWPGVLGMTGDKFPHGGASMFGIMSAMGNFGGIFMPWLIGIVADSGSLRLGLAAVIACPLLMILTLRHLQQGQ